jgi:hypothetical protein
MFHPILVIYGVFLHTSAWLHGPFASWYFIRTSSSWRMELRTEYFFVSVRLVCTLTLKVYKCGYSDARAQAAGGLCWGPWGWVSRDVMGSKPLYHCSCGMVLIETVKEVHEQRFIACRLLLNRHDSKCISNTNDDA